MEPRLTQLKAYHELVNELPEKRRQILEVIKARGEQGATLFELVTLTGKPVNEISGRVTELSKSQIIIDADRRVNPLSNKFAIVWKINKEKIET